MFSFNMRPEWVFPADQLGDLLASILVHCRYFFLAIGCGKFVTVHISLEVIQVLGKKLVGLVTTQNYNENIFLLFRVLLADYIQLCILCIGNFKNFVVIIETNKQKFDFCFEICAHWNFETCRLGDREKLQIKKKSWPE